MFRFITICSKVDISQDELAYITSYIGSVSESNLDTIVEVSHREGLLPIVYKKLKSLLIDNSYLLSQLKQAYLYIVQKNIHLTTQLIELITILEENDIDVISIKGVTLAQLAYGDITLRQFGDIDILIRESQLQKADRVLKDQKYQSLYRDGILSDEICLEKLIDITYIRDYTTIEIHWRLLESKHNGDMALKDPFDFTQSIDINSTILRTLSSELLLVYITLHGAKHAWGRIGWICDIDRLVRAVDIEWQKSIDIVKDSKIRRAFYVGLYISHHLYETPIPSEVSRLMGQMDIRDIALPTIDRFERYILRKSPINGREIFLYQIQLFDHRADQIYFLFQTIFTISPADCIRFDITYRWRFLYIFLRPFRIITGALSRKANL